MATAGGSLVDVAPAVKRHKGCGVAADLLDVGTSLSHLERCELERGAGSGVVRGPDHPPTVVEAGAPGGHHGDRESRQAYLEWISRTEGAASDTCAVPEAARESALLSGHVERRKLHRSRPKSETIPVSQLAGRQPVGAGASWRAHTRQLSLLVRYCHV